MLVCLVILIAGRLGFLSHVFDRDGFGKSFASDGDAYFEAAMTLIGVMKQEGLMAWFNSSFPLHTKLYSLTFAALGPVVGFNILAAEPLNLLCYLTILWVVFKLGSELFDRRVGLMAAMVVALWPSILMHTTQLLKDPFFIAAFLGLILLASRGLTRELTLRQGLITGAEAGVLTIFLWSFKPDLRELSLLASFIAITFVLLKAIKEKRIIRGNLVATLLTTAFLLVVPVLVRQYHNPNPHPLVASARTGATVQNGQTQNSNAVQPPSASSGALTRLRERIAWARYLYVNYPSTGSNIDAEVRLESWADVLLYMPRALEIGLFAPFPNTWLNSGSQVGRAGRLLSGLETLLMYFTYPLIAIGVWKRWQKGTSLPAWFLIAIFTAGTITLSVVVANVGALFRLRYPFWILLIIVATDAIVLIAADRKAVISESMAS